MSKSEAQQTYATSLVVLFAPSAIVPVPYQHMLEAEVNQKHPFSDEDARKAPYMLAQANHVCRHRVDTNP